MSRIQPRARAGQAQTDNDGNDEYDDPADEVRPVLREKR